MQLKFMFRAITVLGALVVPLPAWAATFCVDDAGDLEDALLAAGFSGSEDAIRLEAGVYDAPSNGGFIYSPLGPGGGGDIDISGGWNNNCTARVAGQRSTLDGNLQQPVLTVNASNTITDVVRVHDLQIIRGRASSGGQAGGLTIRGTPGFIEIDSNRFSDNTANHPTLGAAGALVADAVYSLFVRNNVFVENDADTTAANAAGAAALTCQFNVDPNIDARFVNNTVVRNAAAGGAPTDTGGIRLDGDCPWEIANNIVWDNAGLDLDLHATLATLRNNDLGERGGSTLPTTDSANLGVDPQFISATSLRLKRASPLIDAGLNTPAGGLVTPSFDGGPRRVGPRVDIGAYELDVLFAAAFESGFGPAGGPFAE